MMGEKKVTMTDVDQGVFQERLWKDYGKTMNRNSGMTGSRGNGMERTTESRVCYGVIAWVNNNSK